MFIKKPQHTQTGLEEAIDQVLFEMRGMDAHSDEYAQMVKQLTKLYKLKEIDKPEHVSRDTLAIILGNLGVAIIILAYEQKHVITTKTPSFMLKPR
jgi:hypothetical protein